MFSYSRSLFTESIIFICIIVMFGVTSETDNGARIRRGNDATDGVGEARPTDVTTVGETTRDSDQYIFDERGYIIYCPCMGRFGNQAEHFLGSLAFAKAIDRTLILPPWRTYKNVEFDEWFLLSSVQAYHRVILASDFMKHLAAKHWPPDLRKGFCWLPPSSTLKSCNMKQGNPFGPFWDGLGVNFVGDIIYHESFENADYWKHHYPAKQYPVIAMRGAPARFPAKPQHWPLQKYLIWSQNIQSEAEQYIKKTFRGQKFIGIHLRNHIDWELACKHAKGLQEYMASPQCLLNSNKVVTPKLCFPDKEEILRLVKNVVKSTKAQILFVATDKDPMIQDLEEHLHSMKVKVFHLDPWLPQIDLAILAKSDHFIGNCVSSFSAFVRRDRNVHNLPTSYWGFS